MNVSLFLFLILKPLLIFLIALTMGFSALDFDKIYENGGKEYLETEYKEFKCTPKASLAGQTFDIAIKVELD